MDKANEGAVQGLQSKEAIEPYKLTGSPGCAW